jgi:hypothetical protein
VARAAWGSEAPRRLPADRLPQPGISAIGIAVIGHSPWPHRIGPEMAIRGVTNAATKPMAEYGPLRDGTPIPGRNHEFVSVLP